MCISITLACSTRFITSADLHNRCSKNHIMMQENGHKNVEKNIIRINFQGFPEMYMCVKAIHNLKIEIM